jgi:glycosyltransferase involved in cell wall biosynthesis
VRILVATDQWSPDVIGGSARVAADGARALAARGHEIVVLAPARPGLDAVADDDGIEVRRVIDRWQIPQTLGDPVLTRRQARRLRHRAFDVLLAHQATNAVGLAAGRLGTPLALVFHASAVLELRFLRERLDGARKAASYALEPVLRVLERRALRSAAGVLVLSRFSQELLTTRDAGVAGRVHVVGGGVDDRFFAEPPDLDACRRRLGIPPGRLLLTARRLEPRMGIDLLIQALPLVGDDEVVLAVAGNGPWRPQLERLVRELRLEQRVRLLGRVSEDDLRSLYAAADLFVLPSVAYEGFGMSTVEALAAGTPVLGTAVGATPEIIGELGEEFIVDTAAPLDLAGAIRDVLPRVRPEMRARARRLAEDRYRWERVIPAWEEALRAISRC